MSLFPRAHARIRKNRVVHETSFVVVEDEILLFTVKKMVEVKVVYW